jgi:2-polyprenyl-6-methoxyphenol hydroxylase-like FAD-dependent oxidoreductase
VLAGEIHRAHGDLERAFAEYEARLRSFVTSKQRAAVGFLGFFAPRTAFGLKFRTVAVKALSIPFVARGFLSRAVKDNLELPTYA